MYPIHWIHPIRWIRELSARLKQVDHFAHLESLAEILCGGAAAGVLEGVGVPGRILTRDPRLRRPGVGSVINRRLSPTSPRWSGSREFTPILAALRRFIALHAITDRRDDHVNVADEPAMRSPCSLGRVPTSVTTSSASCASTCPRSWRSCTRSSTSAIQTRFGVTSTPAPRGGSVRSRGSRAPCTVPCVSGARPRPCGPVGSGRPCS